MQKNGNINQLTWWTTDANQKSSYGYEYDHLDQLTTAHFGTINGGGTLNPTGDYDTDYEYDKRGNITKTKPKRSLLEWNGVGKSRPLIV